MRVIDADDIIKGLTAVKSFCDLVALDGMIGALEAAPTIDAEPVRHGKWIDDTGCLSSCKQYKCSECGRRPILNEMWCYELTEYCPFCGAKMGGE